MIEKTCSVEGCQRVYRSRGLCSSHYNRGLRDGTLTLVQPQAPAEERFWRFVDADGDCWDWTGTIHSKGYGYFNAGKDGNQRAHRYAWTILVGPIPPHMTIDHVCKRKHCVNPDHMEIVTTQENNLRSGSFSALNARKTHCKNGHEFTLENTYVQYNKGKPGRRCRTCQLAYMAKRNGVEPTAPRERTWKTFTKRPNGRPDINLRTS